MGASQRLSTLSCEINIIRAKNVELKTEGKLFVRCYLSAGNNQRAGLNSRGISSKSELFWGESFSLDCSGSEESIQSLMEETVVFELRWRSKVPVLGRVLKSQVLGRVEIPWKSVFSSEEMEVENWVPMVSAGSGIVDEDCKPPALQVGMKVRIPEVQERRRGGRKWDECGCTDGGCSCVDADHVFALAAALS